MRRAALVVLISSLAFACGAPPPVEAPQDSPACRRACADAAEAWAALASDADAAAQPEEGAPSAVEQALDRLEDHVASLNRSPREVSGDEAFALSSAVMDAVDAAGGQIPSSLRDRADAAAEAILTDRGEDGALRAARDATEVLEQVLQTVRPGAIEGRDRRRAMADLGRRARAAADAYREEGPARGDLRADRSEGITVSDDAPEALRRSRQRAVDASASVRHECGVERRLAVPTL